MTRSRRLLAALVALTFVAAACSAGLGWGSGLAPASAPTASRAPDSQAGELRTRLDLLLGEQLVLAAKASAAALGGRQEERAAYADLLAGNGKEIGELFGAAYGTDAQGRFDRVWSAHNGFLLDYSAGLAARDQTMQDLAASELSATYLPQFAELVSSTTALPKETLAGLARSEVAMTRQVIDEQAAGNWAAAYAGIRGAYLHTRRLGDLVSESTARKYTARYAGDSKSAGVELRVTLDLLLQEHAYLAGAATAAAVGGRADEFSAAGKSLNDNGVAVGLALGALFSTDWQTRFNQVWSSQNGYLVDYTSGLIARDKARQEEARGNLMNSFVPQFADLIAGAAGRSGEPLAELTRNLVQATTELVDAQAAGDAAAAAARDRAAARQTQPIGNQLAAYSLRKPPPK